MDREVIRFACVAHKGQRRKFGQPGPYSRHVVRVARMVESMGGSPTMVSAALLHDTIEDCGVSRETISSLFGEDVAKIVEELTDVYTSEKFPTMNRKARKSAECTRIGKTSEAAKFVKLADYIDNLRGIPSSESFRKTAVAEIMACVVKISPAVCPAMYAMVKEELSK